MKNSNSIDLFGVLLVVSSAFNIAVADPKYPTANFKPYIVYQD